MVQLQRTAAISEPFHDVNNELTFKLLKLVQRHFLYIYIYKKQFNSPPKEDGMKMANSKINQSQKEDVASDISAVQKTKRNKGLEIQLNELGKHRHVKFVSYSFSSCCEVKLKLSSNEEQTYSPYASESVEFHIHNALLGTLRCGTASKEHVIFL